MDSRDAVSALKVCCCNDSNCPGCKSPDQTSCWNPARASCLNPDRIFCSNRDRSCRTSIYYWNLDISGCNRCCCSCLGCSSATPVTLTGHRSAALVSADTDSLVRRASADPANRDPYVLPDCTPDSSCIGCPTCSDNSIAAACCCDSLVASAVVEIQNRLERDAFDSWALAYSSRENNGCRTACY